MWGFGGTLAADFVNALTGFGPGGFDGESHLLADRARQKSADGMRLPFRRFHQFLGCDAARPLEQFEHFGGLAAVAGLFGFLSASGCFLSRASLLNRLTLGGRNVGATCASTGLLRGLRLGIC